MKMTSFFDVSSRKSCKSSKNHSTSVSTALVVGAWTGITVILNGLPRKWAQIILSLLRLHPNTVFWTLLLTLRAAPFLPRDSCQQFNSVQLLSHARLFATPWIAAHQASLSIPNSRSSLRLTSIESVMPSNHLILCCPFSSCPQSFPASGSFPMNWFFESGGQSTRASASASVLPVNVHDWFPLEWTGWISLQSKGLSRVFSQHHSSKASILRCSVLMFYICRYMYICRPLYSSSKNPLSFYRFG